MRVLRNIVTELVGLFIDDGALALLTLAVVAAVTLAVKIFTISPLFCGLALLVGYLVILCESVVRFARK